MPKNNKEDRGRNYYETSSPFETYGGPSREAKPKTFSGLTDSVVMPKRAITLQRGQDQDSAAAFHPEQYDNPRGYPGLAMVMKGDEKCKLPMKEGTKHSIMHHAEGEAALARTGKRT